MNASILDRLARATRLRCFSLSETVLVVAILGMMTALALPMLSHAVAGARFNKTRQSAQDLVSVAAAAVAAGDTSIPAARDAEGAVRLLMEGITIAEGLEGMHFKVRTMPEKDVRRVTRYLRMEDGLLVFTEPEEDGK